MSDKTVKELEIRYSTHSDIHFLIQWLNDPKILRGFPLHGEQEIRHAAEYWMSFHQCQASLTALYQGQVAGIATLILNIYTKVAHHALLSIIVGEPFRNLGIGTVLLEKLCCLAKERFRLEVIYLEVYEENPAIHLYERLGFVEVGRQKHFYKDEIGYLAKITMEKFLS